MPNYFRRSNGFTMLEIIMVLAVGVSIVLFSIQQYLSFRKQADLEQLRANVNILFGAMGDYFRAHCDQTPFNAYVAGQQTVAVTYQTLLTEGYLTHDLPISPFLKYSGIAPNGYVLQFNQIVTGSKTTPLAQRTILKSPANSGTTSVGSILVWQAQVAVQLNDPINPGAIRDVLQADCLSDASGSTVLSCTVAPATATQFAVWVRLPSLSSVSSSPHNWLWKPNILFFKQMYTTNPITILTNPNQTTLINSQYYVCGT